MFSFSEKNGAGFLGKSRDSGSGQPDGFAPVFSLASAVTAGAGSTVPPWGTLPWDEIDETASPSPLYMARDAGNRSGVGTDGGAASKVQESTLDGESGSDSKAEEDEENSSSNREEPENGVTNVNAKEAAKAAFLKVLHRAKEGDRNAFEEIYQLYHRRIYNAVYGMLSDADDAQDVTQDVFIRLHDALPTLRADEAFSTYLYRIALNLCRDRARRRKRVRFQSIDTPRASDEGNVEPMDFPDAGKLPEEMLSTDELQVRVREAVQTLSEDHKAVIVMHHFQGMEVNTIAEILGVPSGTVKSRLARGRDQLHRKLRSYLDVQG